MKTCLLIFNICHEIMWRYYSDIILIPFHVGKKQNLWLLFTQACKGLDEKAVVLLLSLGSSKSCAWAGWPSYYLLVSILLPVCLSQIQHTHALICLISVASRNRLQAVNIGATATETLGPWPCMCLVGSRCPFMSTLFHIWKQRLLILWICHETV